MIFRYFDQITILTYFLTLTYVLMDNFLFLFYLDEVVEHLIYLGLFLYTLVDVVFDNDF